MTIISWKQRQIGLKTSYELQCPRKRDVRLGCSDPRRSESTNGWVNEDSTKLTDTEHVRRVFKANHLPQWSTSSAEKEKGRSKICSPVLLCGNNSDWCAQNLLTYFLSRASKHPLIQPITWQAPGQSPLSLNTFRARSEKAMFAISQNGAHWTVQITSQTTETSREVQLVTSQSITGASHNSLLKKGNTNAHPRDTCQRRPSQERCRAGRWCWTQRLPAASWRRWPTALLSSGPSGTSPATERECCSTWNEEAESFMMSSQDHIQVHLFLLADSCIRHSKSGVSHRRRTLFSVTKRCHLLSLWSLSKPCRM